PALDLLALVFILGLPLGGLFINQIIGSVEVIYPNEDLILISAGLLVGFGARLGSGCTSGHGVCGLSRLSLRSIFATGIFMLSGFATVALMRSLGLSS
ncbi:MAG: YeeE/YedE family protein, partial [Methylocystis sp.]